MATVLKGKTFASGEVVTPAKLHQMVDAATVSEITNSDIASSAGIAASKLASTLNFSTNTITLPAALALSYPTLTGVREAIVDVGAVSGTQTLNLQNGNIFQVKPNSSITIAFSNVPSSGTFVGVLIRHEGDGTARTYTWPANTKWAYGETPTFTSTNAKFDIVSLFTYNGGSVWFGQVLGQNY
jgi:hypothetical protein